MSDYNGGANLSDPRAGVASGLLVPGNINLAQRVDPLVQNSDGSYSTLLSSSFEDDKGRQILIPQVINRGGKWETVPMPDAIRHYYDTGEHLGIFDTPENADHYAVQIHNDLADKYQQKTDPKSFMRALIGLQPAQPTPLGSNDFVHRLMALFQ